MAGKKFRRGFDEVEKAAEEAKGTPLGRLGFFGLKDGESITVRFLDEEPIATKFYEYVATADGKSTSFIVAPDLYADDDEWQGTDWVKKYGGKIKEFGTGNLVDLKAVPRTVGVAVVREEVLDENASGRRRTTTQDKITTVTKGSETFPAREFIVVRMAYKNFWSQVSGFHQEYGTICDRDYKITRRGSDQGTVYSFVARPEDPDFSIEGLHAQYGYGTGKTVDGQELTPEHPDRFLYCPQTLEEWAEEMASEKRAKHFLRDVKAEASERHSGGDSGGAWSGNTDDEANVAPPPDSQDSNALRARLQRHVNK